MFWEINGSLGPDTTFVTAIGRYQVRSGRFPRTFTPRHCLVCSQAGPLGWEAAAGIGVKSAFPEKQVVGGR